MNATAKFTRPVRPGTEWNGFTCTERAFFMSNLSVHSYIFQRKQWEKKHNTKTKQKEKIYRKYESQWKSIRIKRNCLGIYIVFQQKVINFNIPMRKPIISTI